MAIFVPPPLPIRHFPPIFFAKEICLYVSRCHAFESYKHRPQKNQNLTKGTRPRLPIELITNQEMSFDTSCFDGNYITEGVTSEYLNNLHNFREKNK